MSMFKVVIDMKCNLVMESDTILNNPIPFKKKKKRRYFYFKYDFPLSDKSEI